MDERKYSDKKTVRKERNKDAKNEGNTSGKE